MTAELRLLDVLLFFAFVLAPRMANRFFLRGSKTYSRVHMAVIAVLFIGTWANFPLTTLVWPAFCLYGFSLFIMNERDSLLSFGGAATSIPFVFSIISSIWYVAGSNDWRLLGYDPAWSFYAALHGIILGWLFVGCLAQVAKRLGLVYLVSCCLSLVLFLCVAFGIDGVPVIKKIGVVGFSVLVPFAIYRYARSLSGTQTRSLRLAFVSLFGICVAMTLALVNEFGTIVPRALLGIPTMVLAHGAINALVVVPCFYLAIRAEQKI